MKAKLISDGTVEGTRVTDLTGEPVHGVYGVRWSAAVNEPPVIEIEISAVAAEVEGQLLVYAQHPVDGTFRQISSMTFADGSVWDGGVCHG